MVCCLLLLLQNKLIAQQYPFDSPRADWLAAKKIGVVDLRYPKQLMKHVPASLTVHQLNEKSVGFLDRYTFGVQIADEANLILIPNKLDLNEPDMPRLWLSNYPTTSLVDTDQVAIVGAIRVTGNRSYESVAGQRTIRKIEFLPKADSENLVQRYVDELEAFEKSKDDALFFKLKSKAGTEIEAKFIKFQDGLVELKARDGRTLKLALSVFADQTAFELKKLIKEQSKKRK